MSDDWDPENICRDDDCEIEEVHLAHKRMRRRRTIIVHHRPRDSAPLSPEPEPDDILAESIERAVGHLPTMTQWILRDVRDDYGKVSERSIYRRLNKLIQQARIIKLDVGLAFAAYVSPKSRMLRDPEALRDYMLSNADCIPVCTKTGGRRYA